MKKSRSFFIIILSVFLFSVCLIQTANCEGGRGLLGLMFNNNKELGAKRQFKFINYSENTYPQKPKDATIDLFFDSTPQNNYEVIGEIAGWVESENNLKPFLKEKVRQVGGDGLINIQTSAGSQTYSTTGSQSTYQSSTQTYLNTPVSRTHSMSVMNISGKVIKYINRDSDHFSKIKIDEPILKK